MFIQCLNSCYFSCLLMQKIAKMTITLKKQINNNMNRERFRRDKNNITYHLWSALYKTTYSWMKNHTFIQWKFTNRITILLCWVRATMLALSHNYNFGSTSENFLKRKFYWSMKLRHWLRPQQATMGFYNFDAHF